MDNIFYLLIEKIILRIRIYRLTKSNYNFKMSFGNGQNTVVAASLNDHQFQTTGEANASSPHQTLTTNENSTTNENLNSNHENDNPLNSTHREDVANASAPRTPGPPEKETRYQGGDSPAIEESTEAMLERLGRQRPEVFDSIWAEIGFVFSISMSQVLTV